MKNWKNVKLTESQNTLIMTLKKAILNEYNIELTTNDILARLLALGFKSLDRQALIEDPMIMFQEDR